MSAIRSLWDGKRTLRKPYSTSSIYEYTRQQKGLTAPRCKFPVPHFEFPASGEEPAPASSMFVAPGQLSQALEANRALAAEDRHALREF
jgi:hypothetical protein